MSQTLPMGDYGTKSTAWEFPIVLSEVRKEYKKYNRAATGAEQDESWASDGQDFYGNALRSPFSHRFDGHVRESVGIGICYAAVCLCHRQFSSCRSVCSSTGSTLPINSSTLSTGMMVATSSSIVDSNLSCSTEMYRCHDNGQLDVLLLHRGYGMCDSICNRNAIEDHDYTPYTQPQDTHIRQS